MNWLKIALDVIDGIVYVLFPVMAGIGVVRLAQFAYYGKGRTHEQHYQQNAALLLMGAIPLFSAKLIAEGLVWIAVSLAINFFIAIRYARPLKTDTATHQTVEVDDTPVKSIKDTGTYPRTK
jgi:hypothetical protein